IDIYENFYGIGFIVSGDRQTITPEKISFIHAGNVTPMTIGVYHRTYSLSDAPYKRYGMKFTPEIAKRCIEQIGEKNFHNVMSHLCYELSPACQQKVRQMFDDMLYEYEHYDANSEFIIEGILSRLIITLLREGKAAESADIKLNIQDKAINEVLVYLDLHYAENPSIETLASLAGLSASHFMKRFRECVGSSYKTYLHCYKIRMAQNMLVNTKLSVSQISEALGFCNSNYFCKIFHKISGNSPREFRKEQFMLQ
ncbi:MAG: AraC family transcriptional regulator, partial [Lachnospiraceae bacterium]|nr:AraC family transcriptional regulator [Lachnospiraceae bacterium]